MKSDEKRDEMLERLGITDGDFRDYLRKLCAFLNSLERSQREFHFEHCGKRTAKELEESFGPGVTAEDLEQLFCECPPVHGIFFVRCC
jgi:hypothetical protein